MLMRFGVENHLSIKEYQEFSMVASSLKDPASYLISVPGIEKSILPIGVIYGANASGKSNVLAAWSFFRVIILESHGASSRQPGIPREPFRLDPETANTPSRFDCDVIIAGKRHHYGFVLDNDRVLEEWLYVYPEGRRQIWFHRSHENQPEFSFGTNLKGKKQTLSEFTAPNSLFLSTAASNKHEQLTPIRNYFRNNQRIIFSTLPSNHSPPLSKEDVENSARRQRMVNFLAEGDTGIIDIKLESSAIPEKVLTMRKEFIAVFEKYSDEPVKEWNPSTEEEIQLGHRGKSGQKIFLDMEDESLGTLSLLTIMGPVFDALDQGGTLWVDELSANMHPLLARQIVALFGSQEANPHGAQLICATHDTHLLHEELLRRDQIWFTEKDLEGATKLYPLTDYHVRSGGNLAKEYLQGRYGAIPYLGSLERLLGRTSTLSSAPVSENMHDSATQVEP